ncbi:MAG: 2-amino-4-hydroxy-6-hydroxymethyldihydropteridine diphosphokinase [Syntrophales bacterium]|nr:2-amino-4-hydroxy-6-hydroxymethyldihydropteridine diphosphokinase [Syntrophales bacterium]
MTKQCCHIGGTIAYIGIGSNLANPMDQCRKALQSIGEMEGVKLLRSSSFYLTEPFGDVPQKDFVNAVCEVRTDLAAWQLLTKLKEIEGRAGRVRDEHWGPRILDLDLLLFGQDVIKDNDLVIPHPECHKRRFVLVPLAEIASYVIHPAFGVSIKGLLDRLQDERRVELVVEKERNLTF